MSRSKELNAPHKLSTNFPCGVVLSNGSVRQAEAWVETWLDERRLRGEIPASRNRLGCPTVRELAERLLELRDAESDDDLAKATKSANRSHFEVHIFPEFGNDPVAALPFEGARLGQWIRTLKKKRAKQTVRNVVSTFRVLLDFAKGREGGSLISQNPLRDEWFLHLVPPRKEKEGRQEQLEYAPLEPEQVQQLLNCQDVPLRRRVRYAIACTTPLRDGELAGLRWQDISFSGQIPTVQVRRAVAIKGDHGFASPKRPKNAWSARKLPLHPAAFDALKEWWNGGWEHWTGRRPRQHDLVFPRPDRKPQRPRSAEDFVADLKTAELPHAVNNAELVFHDIRCCVATWMLNADVAGVLIRRFLGHAPRGAAEAQYMKGNILPVLQKAVQKIPLEWKGTT